MHLVHQHYYRLHNQLILRNQLVPAPGKAFLKALEKAHDVSPVSSTPAEPELPADASPEERARHEIKKVLRSGGTPIQSFR